MTQITVAPHHAPVCAGCLGNGMCWVCLGTGSLPDPDGRGLRCTRCHGTGQCVESDDWEAPAQR